MKSYTYGTDYKRVIDGGYLSYLIGIRDNRSDFWSTTKWHLKDALLAMDSRSYRYELFPAYKSARSLKRVSGPKKLQYDQVKMFREQIIQDISIEIAQVPGVEADDIVAAVWMDDQDLDVVAIDKDLHQVPGIFEAMLRGSGRPITPLLDKVPQYMMNVRGTPASMVLTQVLKGDKSDSIPRLLSSNVTEAREQWRNYNPKNELRSFERFYKLFGAAFMRNLSLMLIPGPLLSDHYDDSFSRICDGTYWRSENFATLLDRIWDARRAELRISDLWNEEEEEPDTKEVREIEIVVKGTSTWEDDLW